MLEIIMTILTKVLIFDAVAVFCMGFVVAHAKFYDYGTTWKEALVDTANDFSEVIETICKGK